MGQDTLDFGTSFSSVSRRKVCQAGVSFPFEPTEGGQSSVRYAHFVLASFQKILNSFNPVLPRILIFLRGVRCLFRFPSPDLKGFAMQGQTRYPGYKLINSINLV